ncbi:winged helix-turn-helix transcriptional regulator [Nonomuraea sp. NPDC004580]|uniref:winged helix-turn-helix transcriptional regulator n=1 Tax=Nonomuraea sp. NPDC004580 TaxID=3154552 RepID=UPI0033B42F29
MRTANTSHGLWTPTNEVSRSGESVRCGDGSLRFGELRRAVPGISERVLILQLREMETTGLLHREVYHQVPPKVEYSLTEFGHSLNTAMAPLGEWGEEHIERIEAIPWVT